MEYNEDLQLDPIIPEPGEAPEPQLPEELPEITPEAVEVTEEIIEPIEAPAEPEPIPEPEPGLGAKKPNHKTEAIL